MIVHCAACSMESIRIVTGFSLSLLYYSYDDTTCTVRTFCTDLNLNLRVASEVMLKVPVVFTESSKAHIAQLVSFAKRTAAFVDHIKGSNQSSQPDWEKTGVEVTHNSFTPKPESSLSFSFLGLIINLMLTFMKVGIDCEDDVVPVIDNGGRLKGVVKVATLSKLLEQTSERFKMERLARTPRIGRIRRKTKDTTKFSSHDPIDEIPPEQRWHRLPSGFSCGKPSWLITGILPSPSKLNRGRGTSGHAPMGNAQGGGAGLQGRDGNAEEDMRAPPTVGVFEGIISAEQLDEHLCIQSMGRAAEATMMTPQREAPMWSGSAGAASGKRLDAMRKGNANLLTPFGTRVPHVLSTPHGTRFADGQSPRENSSSSHGDSDPLSRSRSDSVGAFRSFSRSDSVGEKLLVSAVMDQAPFLVMADTPLTRVFGFFRHLNVQVVAVVDYFGCVEGIITRQCFSPSYMARFATAAKRNRSFQPTNQSRAGGGFKLPFSVSCCYTLHRTLSLLRPFLLLLEIPRDPSLSRSRSSLSRLPIYIYITPRLHVHARALSHSPSLSL